MGDRERLPELRGWIGKPRCRSSGHFAVERRLGRRVVFQGMQMTGNDINPVAWFVVKQELADVDIDAVKRLLADIEAEVKPQIMPFYACPGPNGEQGTWTHAPTGQAMGPSFDPLALTPVPLETPAY